MTLNLLAHRDTGLRHQDAMAARISATLENLSTAEWGTATNCPPWDVTMLIAHMTRGAESFIRIVTDGTQGITEMTQTREEREQRQRELAALSSSDLLDTFQRNQLTLRDLMAGLSQEQLEMLGRHPWALQPLWWFGDQRLAELAFHSWDLHHSLGREEEIDAGVAQYLLPTILERNVKAFHKPSPASYGRWVIRATDVENGTWLVEPDDVGVSMRRGPAEGDPIIEADASALIRWFYGRADVDALEREGRLQIVGARYRLSAWHDMFPAP